VVDIGSRKPTLVYYFAGEGVAFGMVAPQYGDAMAATTLEELIALGFRSFFSVGTAGASPRRQSTGTCAASADLQRHGATLHGDTCGHVRSSSTAHSWLLSV